MISFTKIIKFWLPDGDIPAFVDDVLGFCVVTEQVVDLV